MLKTWLLPMPVAIYYACYLQKCKSQVSTPTSFLRRQVGVRVCAEVGFGCCRKTSISAGFSCKWLLSNNDYGSTAIPHLHNSHTPPLRPRYRQVALKSRPRYHGRAILNLWTTTKSRFDSSLRAGVRVTTSLVPRNVYRRWRFVVINWPRM